MKKYLFIILALSGCGKPLVPSKVEVEHSVNMQNLEPYVRAYCESQYADPAQIEECITLELGKLLNKI